MTLLLEVKNIGRNNCFQTGVSNFSTKIASNFHYSKIILFFKRWTFSRGFHRVPVQNWMKSNESFRTFLEVRTPVTICGLYGSLIKIENFFVKLYSIIEQNLSGLRKSKTCKSDLISENLNPQEAAGCCSDSLKQWNLTNNKLFAMRGAESTSWKPIMMSLDEFAFDKFVCILMRCSVLVQKPTYRSHFLDLLWTKVK